MIDLNKEREVVHNAVNTLFDIAKVQKAEIDLLNVNIANKQAEIDELKAKLGKAKAVPEGFVVVSKELTHAQAAKISDNEDFFEIYQTILLESDTSEDAAVILIQTVHKAMIEAAQGEEE